MKCSFPYYSDNSTLTCVIICPSNPNTFGYVDNNNYGFCVDSCPNNLYADTNSRQCVSNCPISTLQFADITNNSCVNICSLGKFGQDWGNGTR